MINEFLESDSKIFDIYLKEKIQEDLTTIHLFLNSGIVKLLTITLILFVLTIQEMFFFNLICNIENQMDSN